MENEKKYPKIVSEDVAYTGGHCDYVEYCVDFVEEEGLSRVYIITNPSEVDYPAISHVSLVGTVRDYDDEHSRHDLEDNWEAGPLADIIREVICQQEDFDNGCYKCKHPNEQDEDTVIIKEGSVYMDCVDIICKGVKRKYGCLVNKKTGQHDDEPVLVEEARI